MLRLTIDARIFADCVKRAVDTWVTQQGRGRKANVSIKGDGIQVEISSPSASSTQNFLFIPGTSTISVQQAGTISDDKTSELPTGLLELLIGETLRSKGLISGTTDPIG